MNKYYDKAWNPIVGCQGNFLGCEHCFAKTMHPKRHSTPFSQVIINQRAFRQSHAPSTTILVCSQSDLFQPAVTNQQVDAVIKHILNFPSTQFLVLTKWSQRAKNYFNDEQLLQRLSQNFRTYTALNNISLGVTIEHSQYIGRLDDLLAIHSVPKRFVAFEPMMDDAASSLDNEKLKMLDFAIVGVDNLNSQSIQFAHHIIHLLDSLKIKKMVTSPELVSAQIIQ